MMTSDLGLLHEVMAVIAELVLEDVFVLLQFTSLFPRQGFSVCVLISFGPGQRVPSLQPHTLMSHTRYSLLGFFDRHSALAFLWSSKVGKRSDCHDLLRGSLQNAAKGTHGHHDTTYLSLIYQAFLLLWW